MDVPSRLQDGVYPCVRMRYHVSYWIADTHTT